MDTYSKFVLTLIATALTVIAAQMSLNGAVAQDRNCGATAETACFVTTQPVSQLVGSKETFLRVVVEPAP